MEQLHLVIRGTALLAVGVVISYIGMTSVFVAEDLEFVQATVGELGSVHPRAIPLVAQDRRLRDADHQRLGDAVGIRGANDLVVADARGGVCLLGPRCRSTGR